MKFLELDVCIRFLEEFLEFWDGVLAVHMRVVFDGPCPLAKSKSAQGFLVVERVG